LDLLEIQHEITLTLGQILVLIATLGHVTQLRAGGIRGSERLIFVVMIMNALGQADMCVSWMFSVSVVVMCSEPSNVLHLQLEQQQMRW